jgi:hypothetical protein
MLGHGLERAEPPSTSSQTAIRMFLSLPGLSWPSRICSDRRSGRPASWSVESWRVKLVSCLLLTPPIERLIAFFFLAVTASPTMADFLTFCSRTAVGKYPCCLMRWIASSLVLASTVPFWGLPALFNAS